MFERLDILVWICGCPKKILVQSSSIGGWIVFLFCFFNWEWIQFDWLFFQLCKCHQRTQVPLDAFPDTIAYQPAGHEFPIINWEFGVKLGSGWGHVSESRGFLFLLLDVTMPPLWVQSYSFHLEDARKISFIFFKTQINLKNRQKIVPNNSLQPNYYHCSGAVDYAVGCMLGE